MDFFNVKIMEEEKFGWMLFGRKTVSHSSFTSTLRWCSRPAQHVKCRDNFCCELVLDILNLTHAYPYKSTTSPPIEDKIIHCKVLLIVHVITSHQTQCSCVTRHLLIDNGLLFKHKCAAL